MSQLCDWLPFMIRFDGFNQLSKDIGNRRSHATPVRYHRNTEWVIKKPVRCELHPLKKHFDRHSFFMTIKAKTVDSCVIFIPTDGFLRCLQIARSQRLERAF